MNEGMLTMKKLFALVLALVMILLVCAAYAADLTITNATRGQTYEAFKVFDAVPSDPNDLSEGVSYTATKAQTQVEGVLDIFEMHPDSTGK